MGKHRFKPRGGKNELDGEPDQSRENNQEREALLQYAMETWGNSVYRLALGMTRSHADAEDVYQDTFLRLYNNATLFSSDAHLKAWLLRTCSNRAKDLARSGWKRRIRALETDFDVPDPHATEEQSRVWDAVAQLPDNQRAAVHLHYVDGYTTEDIARILECQPSTARTWLFRARSHVREILEGQAKTEKARGAASPRNIPDQQTRPAIPCQEGDRS